MFFLPVSWNNERNRADRWKKEEVAALSERNVLFRDVACVVILKILIHTSLNGCLASLELYFKNSQSLLLIFVNKNQRKDTRRHLDQRHSRTGSDVIDPSAVFGKMSSRLGFFLASDAKSRETELNIATRKWQAREISNVSTSAIMLNNGLMECSSSPILVSSIKFREELQAMLPSTQYSVSHARGCICDLTNLLYSMGYSRLYLGRARSD